MADDYPEHYRAVTRTPSTLAQALASRAHTGQCALMSTSALIVTSGVPGTGKSTLAIALARELHAVVLSKDVIEAALWRRGISREKDSFWVSHEILTTLADDALRRDQHVVIDTVATTEDVRRDWRDLARWAGCPFVVVLCVCSDIALHRSRLVGRIRGIPG